MTCEEALELLYDYIDKEVNEINETEIRSHLQKCNNCSQKFSLEKKFQEFIDARLSNQNPVKSRDTLKSNILAELDKIDCEHKRTDIKRYNVIAWTFAAVASLVILIGASFFASDYVRHNREYNPFEQAHFSMAELDISTFVKSETFMTITSIQEYLGYNISGAVENYSLIGGIFKEVQGISMAHFLYADNGHIVSVFVAPATEFQIPDDLKGHKSLTDDYEMYDHDCAGCRLVYHKTDKAVIITATNDRKVELLSFIPGFSVL